MIRVKVEFDKNIGKKLAKAGEEATEAIRQMLLVSGEAIKTHMKREMRKPKSGRVYKRGSITHRASAPGQFPAVDTGTLWDEINSQLDRESIALEVGTNVFYGEYLEEKTEKMDSRPWLQPTADEFAPQVAEQVDRILRSFLA